VEYLQGEERVSFIEELRPHIANSKKQGPLRQIAALERKITELTLSSSTNGGPVTGSTAPSTPNLVVEVSSDVPTPCLTTEQNSPESTSPPSTSISATDDITEKTAQVPGLEKELVKGLVEGRTEEN
jgi:mRNA-binding protein PUF3